MNFLARSTNTASRCAVDKDWRLGETRLRAAARQSITPLKREHRQNFGHEMVSTLRRAKPMQAVDVSLATLNSEAKLTANIEIVDTGMAMSVAQADVVLAQYGYVDADAVAA